MKITATFEDIVATCTLVSMRGVIPSLLEYQTQLRLRIEHFSQELSDKRISAETQDAMRRLLCKVVDSNTQRSLASQGVSWHGYELEHLFYGYSASPLFDDNHGKLLFTHQNKEVVSYALLLSSLSPEHLPGSEYLPSQPLTASSAPLITKHVVPLPAVTEKQPAQQDMASVHFWKPLLLQLFTATLLLAGLWVACWYYLKEGT